MPVWPSPDHEVGTDPAESVASLLGGAPRIAALWDDLDAGSGVVIAEPGRNSMTIHYVSVPEFASTSPNYFSVTLRRSGRVDLDWQATALSDSLVGITQGGGAVDPGETDLSFKSLRLRT